MVDKKLKKFEPSKKKQKEQTKEQREKQLNDVAISIYNQAFELDLSMLEAATVLTSTFSYMLLQPQNSHMLKSEDFKKMGIDGSNLTMQNVTDLLLIFSRLYHSDNV